MKQTLTIRLGKEQIEKLKELAKAEDRSLSAIIRRFVEDGFKERTDSRKIKRVVGL